MAIMTTTTLNNAIVAAATTATTFAVLVLLPFQTFRLLFLLYDQLLRIRIFAMLLMVLLLMLLLMVLLRPGIKATPFHAMISGAIAAFAATATATKYAAEQPLRTVNARSDNAHEPGAFERVRVLQHGNVARATSATATRRRGMLLMLLLLLMTMLLRRGMCR